MSPPNLELEIPNVCLTTKSYEARRNEKKKPKNSRTFGYGNYNRYYGYRNAGSALDKRVEVFQSREELFRDKDVLDIGCNIGHVTYLIGRDLGAKTVLGIDLDNGLIQIARKNVRHYNCTTSPPVADLVEKCDITPKDTGCTLKFPDNVSFLHSNYVLPDDDSLAREEPRYGAIVCLSVTKWIHLNWGDEGLKRAFKRMFLQLYSGGVLILEAQPFESYKKKKIPVKLRVNADKMQLLPSMFESYLISEIGFESCETLPVPNNTCKGFQRPIQIFRKR